MTVEPSGQASGDDNSPHLLLGVTGSVACYKACEIASTLTQEGVLVTPVLTDSAARMTSPDLFRTLTREPVFTDLFEHRGTERYPAHIDLAERADLILVAPATANIIGKTANGIGDDLLSTLLLSALDRGHICFAPAMNKHMFQNPALQENIKDLRDWGCSFIEPEEGYQACGDVGRGRLSDVNEILATTRELLDP